MAESVRSTLVALLALLVALAMVTLPAQANAAPGQARGQYIVTATGPGSLDNVGARLRDSVTVEGVLRGRAFNGFVVSATPAQARGLRSLAGVAGVEIDGTVTANETSSWGIDRIDQRDLPLDGLFTSPLTGAGAHIYVIDTGITETSILAGRVGPGVSFVKDRNGTSDCNGHGTHVAGTAAGSDGYGVAPQSVVHPVRVLGCNGSGRVSSVISGLNWIAENAPEASVANASLGGGRSDALDEAVAGLVASGTPIAVAAGNSAADACNSSPAAAPDALTVGASTSTDARSSFSNFGPCLDLFAPGSAITSVLPDDSTATWNGTSMAAPHVAGAVAAFLSVHPAASPAAVNAWVLDQATPDRIANAGTGSPNRLLYIADNAGDLDTTPPGPVSGLTVVSVGQTEIQLAWSNPSDADLAQIVVRRAVGSTAPSAPWLGSPVSLSEALATGVLDGGLKSGTTYSYAVFTVDATGNVYSPGQTVTATTAGGTTGGKGPKAKA